YVFSVTEKVRPTVVGDGQKNLLELVFENPMYARRFDLIFSEEGLDPQYVPTRGEKYQLGIRGSHSKGCLFLDGKKWIDSTVLDRLVDHLSMVSGFYMGRLDIKFESLSELKAGRYKIIEINGVGGESSNFYDPRLSKWEAYKIMFRQWKLIFQIGSRNREQGHRAVSNLWDLFAQLYQYRRAS
ncbi:MAG: hypothetical protein AAF203_05460, partial [Pseudomonadota bacterium]